MGDINPYQAPQANDTRAAPQPPPPTAGEKWAALGCCGRWIGYAGAGVMIGYVVTAATLPYGLEAFEGALRGGQAAAVGPGDRSGRVLLPMRQGFRRSSLWNPVTWPDPNLQPSLAKVLKDQVPSCETPVEELDAMIQDAYRNRLY